MSEDKQDASQNVSLGSAAPMTPEVFADHVLGVEICHGVGRVLMVKHRPVAALISGNIGIADTPAEACVLMMPVNGLRELHQALGEELEKFEQQRESTITGEKNDNS